MREMGEGDVERNGGGREVILTLLTLSICWLKKFIERACGAMISDWGEGAPPAPPGVTLGREESKFMSIDGAAPLYRKIRPRNEKKSNVKKNAEVGLIGNAAAAKIRPIA